MQDNFETSLEHVLSHEGGYVNHPDDPGGATNKGVTLAVFRRHYGDSMGVDELRSITRAQLEHIYKSGYWDKCRCDELPTGVDYVVFDQAVNSGPGRSIRWLQAAVGAQVDGRIGPLSVAAAQGFDPMEAVNQMCDRRLAFLQQLDHWGTFGRGWTRRVAGVRAYGVKLCGREELSEDVREDGANDAPEEVGAVVAYDIVREGSRGEWVSRLQRALEIEADGVFGPQTKAALEAFQEREGLTVDGVAGRVTFRALGLLG